MIEALMDNYTTLSDLPTLATLAAINTEYPVFDTTKLAGPMRYEQTGAAFAVRRSAGHIKRAFLSIYTDVAVTVFFKHLCAQIAAPDATSWDVVPDADGAVLGTLTDAGKLWTMSYPFTGDDHLLTVKTGAGLPSVFRCSLRFTIDQALNA